MASVARPVDLGEALRLLRDGPMDVLAGSTKVMGLLVVATFVTRGYQNFRL